MTPLLGTNTSSTPVGDVPAGDNKAARSKAAKVFTKHETRITAFFRITDFAAVRFSVGVRGMAPPETSVRTTAPTGESLFPGSPLFTIVHYCSPLFGKKYCPAPVPSHRPVAAFLQVVARHGAAMARHGRPPSPAPATRPVWFSLITRPGSFGLSRSPAVRHFSWSEPGPQPWFSRITNHGLYHRPLTTSLRISTGPFLDILGFLPPDNEFFPRDSVFMPPDYDFFRIFTVLRPHNSSEFPTIPRNSSDTHKPLSAARAPSAPAKRLFCFSRTTQHGFPCPCGDSKESNHKPGQRVFLASRITAFSAFPAHRPSGISPGANQAPPTMVFTRHESRDTNHGFYALHESQLPYPRFPTISRHFPPFPGPPTPLRRSRSASRRAPSAAAPAADRQARKRIAAKI